MKVTVVGASGFVGKHLIGYLREKKVDVLGLEGVEKKNKLTMLGDSSYFKGSRLQVADFSNSDELAEMLRGSHTVFDFVGISAEDDSTFEDVNVGITKSLVRAAKDADVNRFIWNSGLGVAHYGDKKYPHIQNRYFESLAKAERVVGSSGLNWTIFRPSYIVGGSDLFTSRITRQIADGSVKVIGTGEEPMQPIHMDDAAELYYKSISDERTFRKTIDLVGPRETNFREYVAYVAKGMNTVPSLRNISIEDAKLSPPAGMSPEQIDIRVCGETANPGAVEQILGRKLKAVV